MRKLTVCLLLIIFVTGCGSNRNQHEEASAGEVVSSLEKLSPAVFEYRITNPNDTALTLEFTSSQRFDYSITTKDGSVVYLYSSTALFLQALGEEQLKQGEQLGYMIDFTNVELESGEYILTAWMTTANGEKYKTSQKFFH